MSLLIRGSFHWLMVLALLTAGCNGKKDVENGKDKDGKPAEMDDKSSRDEEKPVASLTSVEYQEQRLYTDYLHQTIELTGNVMEVGFYAVGKPVVWLEGTKNVRVACLTRDKAPWKGVLPGQRVKLQGKVRPNAPWLDGLIDCVIVDVKGAPPPTMKPDELAAEFNGNPEAAMKKFEERFFILDAEIASVDTDEFDLADITLKTTSVKPRIHLRFTASEGEQAKILKAGDKVKAVGQLIRRHVSETDVGLYNSIVLEPDL
jgi:hypothetical protein